MSTQHVTGLVAAARAGDPRAQDELVCACLPLVYNIVGRAMNGSCDVDDAVQGTMLRALIGLPGLRSEERFRPWLVAIAVNRIRSHWQDRSTRATDLEDADVVDPGADFTALTVARLNLAGQRRETARATRWLEPDDRMLLSLWWLECAGELNRAEVAAALEFSPPHTAVRVQRMKAQLAAARVVERALAQPPCVALREVAARWDGRPTASWRKEIGRHTRECMRCLGLWSGLVPPESLLAGLALVPVEAALLTTVRSAIGGAGLVPASWEFATRGPDAAAQLAPRVPCAGQAARRRPGDTGEAGADLSGGCGLACRWRRHRRCAVVSAVAAACAAGGVLAVLGPQPCTSSQEENGAASVSLLAALSAIDAGAGRLSPSPASPSGSSSTSAPPAASDSRFSLASSSSTPLLPRTQSNPLAPRAATPTAEVAPSATASQVIALVNKERAAAGCGPLKEDVQLRDSAQGHSDDMAQRDYFSHSDPDGGDPGARTTAAKYHWSAYGENIARGQQTPASVMASWMNSPGHRANILNCSFKDIGVGVHQGPGGPWWTQDFGARL
ncbi:sigma-70 family RNA polymerase sigma factor [Streptomyces roseus]|uniref:sigma-70 family RNA polymerase sigma factor n=1 Tax=Streptomyces roseus TaxID=66430 RepID=UPI00381BF0EF